MPPVLSWSNVAQCLKRSRPLLTALLTRILTRTRTQIHPPRGQTLTPVRLMLHVILVAVDDHLHHHDAIVIETEVGNENEIIPKGSMIRSLDPLLLPLGIVMQADLMIEGWVLGMCPRPIDTKPAHHLPLVVVVAALPLARHVVMGVRPLRLVAARVTTGIDLLLLDDRLPWVMIGVGMGRAAICL